MRKRHSAAVLVVLGVLAASGLAGCGHPVQAVLEVERAIANTKALARSFVYAETTENQRVSVQGTIADDLQYKALVSVGAQPAFEEVVRDDAVADRALSGDGLALFRRSGSAGGTTAVSGGTVFAPTGTPTALGVLESGAWVVDPAGAPSLVPSATAHHPLGADPVYDSLTIFDYVESAMRQALFVRRFNPGDLNYKPLEDPFPRPAPGSGVIRYDLDRRNIPHLQQQTGGANRAVPDVGMFRKMSIYVQHGRVIQILEQIDVASRLKDLSRSYNITFKGTVQESVDSAIAAINSVATALGREPIRVRTLSVQFLNLGQAPEIVLPSGATVASLSLLENRGRPTAAPTPTS